MEILVIGAGYAGLITATCFAGAGNKVYVYDKDKDKTDKIKQGKAPFYEEKLCDEMAKTSDNLIVTDLKEGFENAEVIFICVGTPCGENGIDLSQINSVFDELAELVRNSSSRKIIVIRSTMLPGTAMMLAKKLEKASGKRHPNDFGIVSNPEFLRQGDAIDDFLHNNKIIIGSENREDAEKIRELYGPFGNHVAILPTKSAEMAKYLNNCLSATKISFINEMGIIAKEFGVDINEIAEVLDVRVGPGNFRLKAGCGFGGSCLEKDVRALAEAARKKNIKPEILESALKTNDYLVGHMIMLLESKLGGLQGKKIGILGISFKRGTDDTRNSRSIPLISGLKAKNAEISAFDPKARITYAEFAENAQKLIDESDAIVIVSDWDEFSELDYGDKIVIDGRNVVPKEKRGKNYEGICWP